MDRYPAAISNKLIKNIEATEQCDGLAIPIMAYRIKFLLVSLIRPDTEEFEEIELTIKEFREYFEISSWGGAQQDALEYAISMLRGTQYTVEGQKIIWLSRESDIDGQNIRLCLNESLTPHLIGLKGNFTKIYYDNIKNLKSKYAFRLYELISSMKGVGKYKIYLKNAYKTIGDNNYTAKSEFLAHVIEPAIAEINLHTDLRVEYHLKKPFGVPEQIIFEIYSNGSSKTKTPTKSTVTTIKRGEPKIKIVPIDDDLIPVVPDDDLVQLVNEYIGDN